MTEAKRKLSATFSPLDHPHRALRRRIQSPFRNFQTQPGHRHRRYRPTPPATYHVSTLFLADPSFCPLHKGAFASSRPSSFFHPFGTARKDLGAHPRPLGCRCWNRCRLRMCTSSAQTAMRSNERTVPQLLSVTPIVKNGFLVKLPLVRVLFPSLSFYFPGSHRHFLALNSHNADHRASLAGLSSIRLGASMRTRLPRRTSPSRQSSCDVLDPRVLQYDTALITRPSN